MVKVKRILKFHIGRGGRFNNPGHLTFTGEKGITENVEDRLFLNEVGDFYEDCNGNEMISVEEVESGIGRIEWDTNYDTDYTRSLEDCNADELAAIAEEGFSFDLLEYLGIKNAEILHGLGVLRDALEVCDYRLETWGIREIDEENESDEDFEKSFFAKNGITFIKEA